MRVLMLGWQLTPRFSGGVGRVCDGLCRGLSSVGIDVLYLMPTLARAQQEARVRKIGAGLAELDLSPPSPPLFTEPPTSEDAQAVDRQGGSPSPVAAQPAPSQPSPPPPPTESYTVWEPIDVEVVDQVPVCRQGRVIIKAAETPLVSPYLTAQSEQEQVYTYWAIEEQRRTVRQMRPRLVQPPEPPEASEVSEQLSSQDVGGSVDDRSSSSGQSESDSGRSHDTDSSPEPATMGPDPNWDPAALLIEEVQRYADRCLDITRHEPFDVIHAHDWMTFPAATAVAGLSGKRLILHVHSTERDRATDPDQVNRQIQKIESRAMQVAWRVICVSRRLADQLVAEYGVDPEKLVVVHNAVDGAAVRAEDHVLDRVRHDDQLVLFMGRLAAQKGPGCFLAAARRLLDRLPRAKFMIAGDGYLLPSLIGMTVRMGMANRVIFAGHLPDEQVAEALNRADVFVMPSINDPFGMVALEAARAGVPVIMSETTGAGELLTHALKVDFWDTQGLADLIEQVCTDTQLADRVVAQTRSDMAHRNWVQAAEQIAELYNQATAEQRAEAGHDIRPGWRW